MTMLETILELAEENSACEEHVEFIRNSYNTIEKMLDNDMGSFWSYWLIMNVNDLPENVVSLLYQKALEISEYAYKIRRYKSGLSDTIKKQAELKIQESAFWSYVFKRYAKIF